MEFDNLEDKIYHAEVEAVNLEYEYNKLYRMRDIVFAEMVSQEISSKGIKTNAAGEREVLMREDWKEYLMRMVEAQKNYKTAYAKVALLRAKYFNQKDKSKAESKAYNYG